MNKRPMLLALALAGASFAALADTAPWPDMSGNTSPWKGTLSRSEVTAEFMRARAEGALPPAGETHDDFSGVGPVVHAQDYKRTSPSLPRAMGAAPASPDAAPAAPGGDAPTK
jgi:hypothetical protein